jgi:small nuclear ribonucleoprotein (snRNP)-like protein
MPVALKKLNDMVGKDVLVVQLDGKAFKGRLIEIDSQAMHITNALEFSLTDKKWKIPVVMVPPDSAVDGDTVKHDKMETVRMREIILSFAGIMRIYPLSTKPGIPEKPAFEKPSTPVARPPPAAESPRSTGGYVIRSVSPGDKK